MSSFVIFASLISNQDSVIMISGYLPLAYEAGGPRWAEYESA